jgi:hypothetical protein
LKINGKVTVKNELQSKEAVLIFLRTTSIHLEGVRKAAKDFIQNPIFQISRSWFRSSSMIILSKNQPDAH